MMPKIAATATLVFNGIFSPCSADPAAGTESLLSGTPVGSRRVGAGEKAVVAVGLVAMTKGVLLSVAVVQLKEDVQGMGTGMIAEVGKISPPAAPVSHTPQQVTQPVVRECIFAMFDSGKTNEVVFAERVEELEHLSPVITKQLSFRSSSSYGDGDDDKDDNSSSRSTSSGGTS
ncbi:hypothetical protein VTI74DRAFT_6179 [Chaetomium olivicolor]